MKSNNYYIDGGAVFNKLNQPTRARRTVGNIPEFLRNRPNIDAVSYTAEIHGLAIDTHSV
jgi:hypothetical protein